jgi:putative ABC transport system permease protein
MIAEDAKKELFKEEEPLDKWINVNGVPFQVVGLYRFENSGEGGMMQRSPVFIPLSAAQRVFNAQRNVDQIMFSFADGSIAGPKWRTAGHAHRRPPPQLRPDGRCALWVRNNVENVSPSPTFQRINAFLWFVGIGSSSLKIVGIGNIMPIVRRTARARSGVQRRAPHRRTLWADPAGGHFVTALFGYLGLALGWAWNWWRRHPGSQLRPHRLHVALRALLALLIAGAIAGFIPARRAAAIRPIEALRDE